MLTIALVLKIVGTRESVFSRFAMLNCLHAKLQNVVISLLKLQKTQKTINIGNTNALDNIVTRRLIVYRQNFATVSHDILWN